MELTEKQKTAIALLTDNITDYVGYGGAAGGGKSVLGCKWLMELGYYLKGAKFFIGRDSIKDTRGSVLKTWGEVARVIGFTGYKFDDNGIMFDNGTEIELLDLTFYPYKDPLFDRLGSKEYTAGWIEEAQQVHNLAFEVLKTRVGRWKNDIVKSKILCTFNPKKNWVDTVFYRPFVNNKETKETKFVYALPTDNQYLPADYIKRLHELKDNATKQRLLFGNFDYDDDPATLIDYESILNMWNRNINEEAVRNTPAIHRYITADIARFGSDKAVIMLWHGFTVTEIITFDTSKTTDIINTIRALMAKNGIFRDNVIVDEDGVGGGVVDALSCRGFVNNSTPRNRAFQNLKSECGYKLAEIFGSIAIGAKIGESEKEIINQELGQLKTYDSDKDNKLRIMPKERIKENIGRSPDYLDNFIMRMYNEIQPKISFSSVGVA